MRTLSAFELQHIAGGQPGERTSLDKPTHRLESAYQDFKREFSNNKDFEKLYPLLVGVFVVGMIFGAVISQNTDEDEDF